MVAQIIDSLVFQTPQTWFSVIYYMPDELRICGHLFSFWKGMAALEGVTFPVKATNGLHPVYHLLGQAYQNTPWYFQL